jgi:hypothetical protein
MKTMLDQFTKPSGLSDEEAIARAIKIIDRAVSNHLGEPRSIERSRLEGGVEAVDIKQPR